MNKGERVGSIILIIVIVIICAINIFVKKFSTNNTVNDEMVEKSLQIDSSRREIQKADSLIEEAKKARLKKSRKSPTKVTGKAEDHILPVIKDENNSK